MNLPLTLDQYHPLFSVEKSALSIHCCSQQYHPLQVSSFILPITLEILRPRKSWYIMIPGTFMNPLKQNQIKSTLKRSYFTTEYRAQSQKFKLGTKKSSTQAATTWFTKPSRRELWTGITLQNIKSNFTFIYCSPKAFLRKFLS